MYEGIIYYRYDRYLDEGIERFFAITGKNAAIRRGRQFRFDDDHWTELAGNPIMRRLVTGDFFMDEIPESEAPMPLTPETATMLHP